MIVVDRQAVLNGRPKQFMTFYNSLTDLPRTIELTHRVNPYVVLDDGVYGVSRATRTLRRVAINDTGPRGEWSPEPRLELNPSRVYDLAAAGGTKLVLLDQFSHRVYRFDVRSGETISYNVATPELDQVLLKIPTSRRPSEITFWSRLFECAIVSIAASPEGDVYLGLSRFRQESGLSFVNLSPGGQKVRTIVCRLPGPPVAFEPSPWVAYHRGRLYLADSRKGLILAYAVPLITK